MCHDPNCEIYLVNFTHDRLSVPSCTDDAITPSRKVIVMVDNESIIMGAFPGSGLLACVIIPGLLVMWDRVLDHMGQPGTEEVKKQ